MNNTSPTHSSAEIGELFKALAKTQGEMSTAAKDKSNPFLKSKYADLTSVIKASRSYLTNNGLCVIQRIVQKEEQSFLSTVLGHLSGQWIESTIKITPTKSDVQSLGSYITYLKRYSYSAMVGVATDDDDGNSDAAAQRNNSRSAPREIVPPLNMKITKEQLEQLELELKDEDALVDEILEKMNIKSLKDMPKSKFLTSLKRIREIKARMK